MITAWPQLKALALSLGLPEVTEAFPWGHEVLKAHGKMWCWWSPLVDGAVFRSPVDEREILLAADPDTFFLHPHYRNSPLVLVRPGRIDPDWAQARLRSDWRALAPKRWLKTWDATQG